MAKHTRSEFNRLCPKSEMADSCCESAPEEQHVYSFAPLLVLALQRSAMCFHWFIYMPLLTERANS